MTRKIVLATGNAGKVREMASLLADAGMDVVAQTELGVGSVEETGLTFVENAIIKARHAAKVTGLPAIADDSGFPSITSAVHGIYSARYAGTDGNDGANIVKLLAALDGVPAAQRQAHFNCVLVYMRHENDPTPIICHGRWAGVIAEQAQGEGGFGYDPVFWLPELNKTAAQLRPEEKQAMSHRGKALALLSEALRNG